MGEIDRLLGEIEEIEMQLTWTGLSDDERYDLLEQLYDCRDEVEELQKVIYR